MLSETIQNPIQTGSIEKKADFGEFSCKTAWLHQLKIGTPVTVNESAKDHNRIFEQSLVGHQGQVVDFAESENEYFDVIVGFPDVPDFGAFNGSMLDIIREEI